MLESIKIAGTEHDPTLDFIKGYDPQADYQELLSELLIAGDEVLDYIEIHQSVLYWSSRLLENLLTISPFGGSQLVGPREMSPSEEYRIQRALYRYELCSILFQARAVPLDFHNYSAADAG